MAIDGTLDGDSESVAIALNAETAGATLKVEGRVMDPLAWLSYSVAVDIVHPSPARLIEVVTGGAQGAAALGPMHVTGTVSGDSTVANIAGIDAMVGDNWLTGGVFLRLDRALPAISADMRAGVLDLTWLGGDLAAAGDAADGAATGEGGATRTPASRTWCRRLSDGRTSLSTSPSSIGSPARSDSTPRP